MALDTFHGVIGWAVVTGIIAQILLGISTQVIHNEDALKENTTENIHGLLGKGVLLGGCINVVIGIQHLNAIFHDGNTAIYYILYLAWMLLMGVAISVLEVGKGRSTQYYSGNIFTAASKYGAKKLFSVPSSAQKKMIDTDKIASPRDNTSPFLYRPSWDSGLKKATPIHKIAAFEEFMQTDYKETVPSKGGVLDRLKGMEEIPRSRSPTPTRENYGGNSPAGGDGSGRSRSSSAQSKSSNGSFRPAHIVTTFPSQISTDPKDALRPASAIERLTRQLETENSQNSFVTKED